MLTTAEHTEIAINRANRTAAYLRENADLLSRYGINANNSITRINNVAHSGVPAYVALDPIINLGNRITHISDRILGITVSRGGRDIHIRGGANNSHDGDLLAAIGMNLVTSIPSDGELYRPPGEKILRNV